MTDPRDAVIEELVHLLSEFSKQKMTDEISYDEGKSADFEGAYDTLIDQSRRYLKSARAALATAAKLKEGM